MWLPRGDQLDESSVPGGGFSLGLEGSCGAGEGAGGARKSRVARMVSRKWKISVYTGFSTIYDCDNKIPDSRHEIFRGPMRRDFELGQQPGRG